MFLVNKKKDMEISLSYYVPLESNYVYLINILHRPNKQACHHNNSQYENNNLNKPIVETSRFNDYNNYIESPLLIKEIKIIG